jgi:predicted O-methyltransferase YrrM
MNYQKLHERMEAVLAGDFDHEYDEVLQALHCMSRGRVYAVINAVVSSMESSGLYVEVGTFQGGSLISALLGNKSRAIGVDSFSEFQQTNNYEQTLGNLEKFGVADRVTLKNMSYQEFFAGAPSDLIINVYYYDGEHNAEGQYQGMEAAWSHLRPGSLIIVDDYSYREVNNAVNRFVANHINHVQFVFVMCPFKELDEVYWNGVVVMKVL